MSRSPLRSVPLLLALLAPACAPPAEPARCPEVVTPPSAAPAVLAETAPAPPPATPAEAPAPPSHCAAADVSSIDPTFLENSGRYADAVAHARIYAADAASLPHAQHMLGHVLPRVGGSKEAVAQFEKAEKLHDAYERAEKLPLGDDWHRAHNLDLLATMYLRLGRLADAEATFRQEVAIPSHRPRNEGSRSALIEFLLLRGQAEEALVLARKMAAASANGSGPLVGHALEAEALLALGRLDEARAAAQAATAALADLEREKSRDATLLVAYYADYAKEAQAEVDLWAAGPARDKGEKVLLELTAETADSHSVDSWGSGLFWIERVAVEAKRAGRDALVTSLHARMKKMDPAYVPGTASAAQPGVSAGASAARGH